MPLKPGFIAASSVRTSAVFLIRLLVQLTLLFLLATFLGPAQYGEFAAIAALALGLGTLSSCGLGFLVLRESAGSAGRGAAMLSRAVGTTFASAAILVPLYALLCFGVLQTEASGRAVVLIAISELLLVPLLGLMTFYLQGRERVARSQFVGTLPMMLRLIGLLACLFYIRQASLDAYAVVHAGGALLSVLVAATVFRKCWIGAVSVRLADTSNLKGGAGYAVMNFTAINPSELDKALALRLAGSSETGVYALATRAMSVFTLPVVAMLLSSQPRIFRETQPNGHSPAGLIKALLGVALLYGLGASLILKFVAPEILEFVFGQQYAGIAELVQLIAAIAPFMCLRYATGGILLALGRPWLRTAIESIALALMVLLALLLTPDHGIEGIVWAILTSEFFMAAGGCLALLLSVRKRRLVA